MTKLYKLEWTCLPMTHLSLSYHGYHSNLNRIPYQIISDPHRIITTTHTPHPTSDPYQIPSMDDRSSWLVHYSPDSSLTHTIHKYDSFAPLITHMLTDPLWIMIYLLHSLHIHWLIPYGSWLICSTPYSYAPLMTHPLTVQPLTLSRRHHVDTPRPALDTVAFLYISQPSGYLVAPVLTWLLSHYLL